MLRARARVFDDVVTVPGPGTRVYYTSSVFEEFLAQSDQIAIQAVADNATGGAISVWIETSFDGRHWATKNPSPEVPQRNLALGQTTVFPYAGDGGSLPSGPCVRLRVTYSTTDTGVIHRAQLRLFAVMRDAGKRPVANNKSLIPVNPSAIDDCMRGISVKGQHTEAWCRDWLYCKTTGYENCKKYADNEEAFG
jgi:hypothetical protein